MPKRDGNAVRVIGCGRSGNPAPPGRGIAVVLIFVLVSGLMTLLIGSGTKGESAAITAPPPVPETPPTSSTVLDRTPVVTATVRSTALNLTVGRLDGGREIWEWAAAGPGPRRLTFTDQLQEGRLNVDARWIAALDADAASLRVGNEPDSNKIFGDVIGYALHQTEADRIAWLSRGADGIVELHKGTAMEDGVDFRLVADLAWLTIPNDGALKLAAFGDWGFLVERWTVDDDRRGVGVFILDPDGALVRQVGECRLWLRLANCTGFWPVGS